MDYSKLNKDLDMSKVKQRSKGGATLSYITGYHAIAAANDIFGEGNWQFRIKELICTDDESFERNGKKGYHVGYQCIGEVNIEFFDNEGRRIAISEFSDVGYGDGTSYLNAYEARESAGKEAATDCLKRCLRFFGNQFGLQLYDEDERNRLATPPRKTTALPTPTVPTLTPDELVHQKTIITQIEELKAQLNNDGLEAYKLHCKAKAASLNVKKLTDMAPADLLSIKSWILSNLIHLTKTP